VFDGEIRNTAPGIQPVRRDNSLGWANFDALGTATSIVAHGVINRQWQIDIQFAQKKHRSCFSRKQQSMLAASAQAGLLCPFHFHYPRSIREYTVIKMACFHVDFIGKLLQASAQYLVAIPLQRYREINSLLPSQTTCQLSLAGGM
jgi:hypothetical protein